MRTQCAMRCWISPLLLLVFAAFSCAFFLAEPDARGGGPYYATTFPSPGHAFIWNLASLPGQQIQYTLDSGPMSTTDSGATVISHANGATLVQQALSAWQNVPTSLISYNNAGAIQGVSGGDVQSVADFNTATTSCDSGQQSPVIFDSDGTITTALTGDPTVIGFTSICDLDPTGGRILAAEVVINGKVVNGASSSQVPQDIFEQVLTQLLGTFSGLDHSQVNVDVLNETPGQCNAQEVAGLPVMFPLVQCQARMTSNPPLPALSPDDIAWISDLYPVVAPAPQGKTVTNTAYGYISGHVYFSDGATPAQGVNVIARDASSPSASLGNAISALSGVFFTGNLGQNVTCTNSNGAGCNPPSPFGSHDPSLIGTYTIPVPMPSNGNSASFTVSVESINAAFTGTTGINPLNPPIPMPGVAPAATTVTVGAGQTAILDITLLNTPSPFDAFENALLRLTAPPVIWDDQHTRRRAEAQG